MVQTIEASAGSPRLSEVLFRSEARNFSSLAGLPSNVDGVEAALTFANGVHPFVTLVGPTGWGKSHLMEAAAGQVSREHGVSVGIHSAVDWVSDGVYSDGAPILLDNVQDALARPRVRQSLRNALDKRVRRGEPTLLSYTGARPSRQLRSMLPQVRDWVVATIKAPAPNERMVVIAKLCDAEGVAISQGLARLMAHKMKGNGRTLVGALKRLRLYGPQWLDSRSTLKACGILDPFFADNSAWDLKEQILRASHHPAFRGGRSQTADMAIFTMLREACLSEAEIARFLNLPPSEVYQRAGRFEGQASIQEPVRAELNAFIETVVDSLLRE